MTNTAGWLVRERRRLFRWELAAAVVLGVGLTLSGLSLGVWLGRLGAYRSVPSLVLVAWLSVPAALALAIWYHRRRSRKLSLPALARHVERQGSLRKGSLEGLLTDPPAGSSSLLGLADSMTSSWLREHGELSLRETQRAVRHSLGAGSLTALAGASIFLLAGPFHGGGASFFQPFGVLSVLRQPVRLSVDRTVVGRGDSVEVTIDAAGRARALLWTRERGETWGSREVKLDSTGTAALWLGPLEADVFLRATSGSRSSDTLTVSVELPALLTQLTLLARYPRYTGMTDEPLAAGDSLAVPIGTEIQTRGTATVEPARARWVSRRDTLSLDVDGVSFGGSLPVVGTGEFTLEVRTRSGSALDQEDPYLFLTVIPDSAPAVTLPVPGRDTTAPLTLRQPLVMDVRDDYLVTRVEVISRRVSQLGFEADTAVEEIPIPEAGLNQAVLQWILDLNGRGFLPGDTAFVRVRAYDNSPRVQTGWSPEYALRLPSLGELREQVRARTEAVSEAVDSVVEAQSTLAEETRDLAVESQRANDQASRPGSETGTREQLPFESAERARSTESQQSELVQRAEQLKNQIRELSEAAWEAGLTDPEWHRQLRDLEQLLEQALSPELEERLAELREALENLDPASTLDALRRLAQTQEELRESLERSRELFERAALEGELSRLAAEAEDLEARQDAWNRQVEQREADSAMAAMEDGLSEEAEDLSQQIEELSQRNESVAWDSAGGPEQRARAASEQMSAAAQGARRGDQRQASESGRSASGEMSQVSEQLEARRDMLRQQWRQEVAEQLDHALAETADLAQRQSEISQRLSRGERGGDLRGDLAAVREGIDQVIERIQRAAGKNALVSPRLGSAMGFTRNRVTEALTQLQAPVPNTRQASNLVNQSLDGLNSVVHALVRSRSDVSAAQSGSGFPEAVERMAQLAEQQQGVNNQAGGMMPLVPMGQQMLMQELRELARQQRRIAEQLQQLEAEGHDGAGELAEEAEDLSESMEAGRLDRETIMRQERLFRRLLDAGRTLQGNEEDPERERQSEVARFQRSVQEIVGPASGSGLRYPYPRWEDLRELSPETRRLILDYFRRLNEGAQN